MTLEWEGGMSHLDEPLLDSGVELHWGEQVTLLSPNGIKWLSIRTSYPEGVDTPSGRLASAIAVGVSAGLSAFASLTLGRLFYVAFWPGVLEEWPGGGVVEALLMIGALAALLGWRYAQKRRLLRHALGVRRLVPAEWQADSAFERGQV